MNIKENILINYLEAQTKKIPYSLVIGDNEINNDTVTYRRHGSTDKFTVTTQEFVDMINKEDSEKCK